MTYPDYPPIEYSEVPIDFKLVHSCTQDNLKSAVTTLSDGSPIPQNFNYIIGTGLLTIEFKSNNDCDVFLGGVMAIMGHSESTILPSELEFSACQTEVPTPLYCVYLD